MSKKVIIIGSGIAGISSSLKLKSYGINSIILDKGNFIGGRISTREVKIGSSSSYFFHGAQFFTTKDSEFNELVQTGAKNKEIAIFNHPQKGPVYVGNPVFNSFISTLVSPFNIVQNALVTKIKKTKSSANINPFLLALFFACSKTSASMDIS